MTKGQPEDDPAAILAGVEIPAWAETREAGAAAAGAPRRLLEDWRPLAQSLDRRIGEASWSLDGPRAFVRGDVPYVVNNSGFAAAAAAELLFAHCEEVAHAGATFTVLELGAGLGLFARQLLAHFEGLCRAARREHDRRLRYLVSDASQETVRAWRRASLFAGFGERVAACVADAERPLDLRTEDGARLDPGPLRMVVFNYALDALPAAIVRRHDASIEQLHVRTWLAAGAAHEAAATDPASLAPLLDDLEFETRFLPGGAAELTGVESLLALRRGAGRAILNFGAIASLEACRAALDPRGVVLVRDFGPATAEQASRTAYPSRFGAAWAMPLDFEFLQQALAATGWRSTAPPGDEERMIHTRLIARTALPSTEERFREVFGDPRMASSEGLPAVAAEHIAAGRMRQTADCLREGLRYCPDDWNLLTQAAQFLNQQLLAHEQAEALARRAAAINPAFSPFVWNTLGNCLFSQGRAAEAHEAYLRAIEIDPDDAQARLNLAYTLERRGATAEALQSIARGLAADRQGTFREALLDKQRRLLASVDLAEQHRRRAIDRRAEAMTSPSE